MNFLPISILAYTLNAGSIIIDKVLLQKSLPNPISYAFFISVLGLLAIVLVPFGFSIPNTQAIIYSSLSGIAFTIALYTMFTSLKYQEASIVGPVVGALNPLFTVMLGGLFFGQVLDTNQYLAIIVLIIGALVVAIQLDFQLSNFNSQFIWMASAGLLFALSYIFLKEAFLHTTFLNVLIISRLAAGLFVLTFLLFPNLRKAIFTKKEQTKAQTKLAIILIFIGQIFGAAQGLLLTFAVSLANPALVNSLFGVQYLVILIFSLAVHNKYPNLLGEQLNKAIISQKIIGVIILSFGLYLLAQ